MFKNFKVMIEKEAGESICCLRTDRGGEFTSIEFNSFCKTSGISRQLTAAYTPQQNGIAERKNRTIMNSTRSMLVDRKVPKEFWPEAVNWTVYLLNRSPTVVVHDKTPEEVWKNQVPSIEHLKVFGWVGYVHIADQKRKKLDNKSEKCVHLGVSKESKAYRMYNPITKRIVISRDVTFVEDEGWEWNKTESGDKGKDVLEWGDEEGIDSASEESDERNEGHERNEEGETAA